VREDLGNRSSKLDQGAMRPPLSAALSIAATMQCIEVGRAEMFGHAYSPPFACCCTIDELSGYHI
jgi:hypothetical protein